MATRREPIALPSRRGIPSGFSACLLSLLNVHGFDSVNRYVSTLWIAGIFADILEKGNASVIFLVDFNGVCV